MSHIKIEVWDATGNKKQTVEVPADAAINRLIAVLVEKMNLPRQSPDGQMMSYKFHHRSSGRQLLDTDTLTTAAVQDGDILRLQPEITAGGLRRAAGHRARSYFLRRYGQVARRVSEGVSGVLTIRFPSLTLRATKVSAIWQGAHCE